MKLSIKAELIKIELEDETSANSYQKPTRHVMGSRGRSHKTAVYSGPEEVFLILFDSLCQSDQNRLANMGRAKQNWVWQKWQAADQSCSICLVSLLSDTINTVWSF